MTRPTLSGHDLSKVDAAYKKLTGDKDKPLINRAIGGDLYPPGSTFKIVTAAAALSSGKFQPDSVLPGPAVLDLPQTTVGLPNVGKRSCGPNDETTFLHAMEISCNTAFGYLGMEIGADALRDQAAKFGCGRPALDPDEGHAEQCPGQAQPAAAGPVGRSASTTCG